MIRILLPLLLAIGLLAGCGQKGPLYLPDAQVSYQPASSPDQ
ncbi:LPS translocon maturation chaperone LptM [Aestuariirhabdus sp. LZHN29]